MLLEELFGVFSCPGQSKTSEGSEVRLMLTAGVAFQCSGEGGGGRRKEPQLGAI